MTVIVHPEKLRGATKLYHEAYCLGHEIDRDFGFYVTYEEMQAFLRTVSDVLDELVDSAEIKR